MITWYTVLTRLYPEIPWESFVMILKITKNEGITSQNIWRTLVSWSLIVSFKYFLDDAFVLEILQK